MAYAQLSTHICVIYFHFSRKQTFLEIWACSCKVKRAKIKKIVYDKNCNHSKCIIVKMIEAWSKHGNNNNISEKKTCIEMLCRHMTSYICTIHSDTLFRLHREIDINEYLAKWKLHFPPPSRLLVLLVEK